MHLNSVFPPSPCSKSARSSPRLRFPPSPGPVFNQRILEGRQTCSKFQLPLTNGGSTFCHPDDPIIPRRPFKGPDFRTWDVSQEPGIPSSQNTAPTSYHSPRKTTNKENLSNGDCLQTASAIRRQISGVPEHYSISENVAMVSGTTLGTCLGIVQASPTALHCLPWVIIPAQCSSIPFGLLNTTSLPNSPFSTTHILQQHLYLKNLKLVVLVYHVSSRTVTFSSSSLYLRIDLISQVISD